MQPKDIHTYDDFLLIQHLYHLWLKSMGNGSVSPYTTSNGCCALIWVFKVISEISLAKLEDLFFYF